ncbi:MAG: hypothetical protein KDK02_03260 [Rhodobacteraceae bacterium]|nr:hypothetical protein [Paracoccaceae bacterium]
MTLVRLIAACTALAVLAGCEPRQGGAPAGVDRAEYERHKANREAYMYQGL